MSVGYLITPSLLGSFSWYLSDESEDARQKFLQILRRERTPTTPAQQKGLDFEEAIKEVCETKEIEQVFHFSNFEDFDDRIREAEIVNSLAAIVKGGLWQQTVKKDLTVGNQEFLLYGKCDVIKRDTIYDIKFTSNYEVGKFLDSSQHLIYLYCLGLPKFQYLISDGKEYWVEDYHNHAGIENEIKSKISDLMSYLENDQEAKEMFFTKWGSK